MKTDQIHEIIRDKNAQRERNLVRSAEQVIEAIVAEQQKVTAAQTRITELREELRKMSVEELDPVSILGGVL